MNRKLNRWIWGAGWVIGLSLLVATANAAAAQQTTRDAVAEGARVYGKMCGRCHNARSPLERTDRDWVTIANHMRVRANLTGGEVRSVLAFLQATNTDPRQRAPLQQESAAEGAARERPDAATGPASTDPQVIVNGEALVDQKACLGCHVVGNAGGLVGPSLNKVVSRRGADFVRRKLADPTFNNAASMMPNFGLTREQIEAILAYLASFNRK